MKRVEEATEKIRELPPDMVSAVKLGGRIRTAAVLTLNDPPSGYIFNVATRPIDHTLPA